MNTKAILVVLAFLVACSVAYDMEEIYGDYWTKLNREPVCFEGNKDRPGIFEPRFSGFLSAVKLVHLRGNITCDHRSSKLHQSFWGCHDFPHLVNTPLNVLITDHKKQVLFPTVGAKFTTGAHRKGRWYSIPGFDSLSEYLVLQHGFNTPLFVGPESTFKLWYGEDLFNYGKGDNRGIVCADVYGYFL